MAARLKRELKLQIMKTKKIVQTQNSDELEIKRSDFSTEQSFPETLRFPQRQMVRAEESEGATAVDSEQYKSTCVLCPLYELNLCEHSLPKVQAMADFHPGASQLACSVHTIPARRTICHPKEWSEFVLIICSGRAVSSVALSDGRRQILSILLPGDVVFSTGPTEPTSGRAVEAITEVTYRKFKRDEFYALMLVYPDLFERLIKVWSEERARADRLALDLGRRTADERIARLILNLAGRLAERGLVQGQTMDFPLRQRQIADATGLTPVHVSKVLGEFQRAGLIEISNRSLTIVDEAELQQVAGPQ
jgi:CRP/FNR family transcriptional regulator